MSEEKTISVDLTEGEISYLIITLNIEMRLPTTSKEHLEGHNKLFKVLTGKDHESYIAWKKRELLK